MRLLPTRPGWLAAAAALLLAADPGAAQESAPKPKTGGHEPPRLVIIVVIDQLCPEYLARPELSAGTLAQLVKGGAYFPDAAHTHTITFTGPGHAAIATGCLPARAGITGNEWYDREADKIVRCIDDPASPLVGEKLTSTQPGASVANLERPTLADVLVDERDEALVVSVGWKDRSALLLGGRHSDGSYWIDPPSGRWVTGSAIRPELPVFLRMLCADPVRDAGGSLWEPRLHDGRPDLAPGERPPPGLGATFPHQIPRTPAPGTDLTAFTELVASTPFADAAVGRAACIQLEHDVPELGVDDVPDLLCVAFASLDYAGHFFGPESCEVAEVLVALDGQLAVLVERLDAHVGAGRWTLALTADHGVQPVPEQSGGRRLDGAAERAALESALSERFGDPPPRAGERRPRWIRTVIRPSLWLDQPRIAAARLDAEAVARFTAESLAGMEGIEHAATPAQLAALPADADPDLAALARDVHPQRSGDVLFLLEPNLILGEDVAATHGTQHAADRRVPVLFYGAGIRPGTYPGPAAPLDIAPTLASLLGLKGLVGVDGHVLEQALATAAAAR